MTREELDAAEEKLRGWHDHQDFLIKRGDYMRLIAQARRAIELEERLDLRQSAGNGAPCQDETSPAQQSPSEPR